MPFHTGQTFVFGEVPAANKWQFLWDNDYALANGTGISALAINASQMFLGMVYRRRGNNSGDATWAATNATEASNVNTDTSAKNVFWQAGSSMSSNGGAVTVTFPAAYNQVPIVMLTGFLLGGATFPELETLTATNFSFSAWSTGSARTNTNVLWLAVGQ